jgi:hypothetical protein
MSNSDPNWLFKNMGCAMLAANIAEVFTLPIDTAKVRL